jgi:aryl-alcohol dehydrogenase-like predicted oxidoreductase
MEQRRLGKTDLRVGAVGLGSRGFGGDAYGPTDDAESMRAIHRALDLGCTFFDTADVYGDGRSQTLLGQALEGLGSGVVVATNAGWVPGTRWGRQEFSYPYLKRACTESLRRLKRRVIDLFQLHGPPLWLIRSGEAAEHLFHLKSEGLINYGGISIRTPEEGFAALKAGVDTLQVVYHMLDHTAARSGLLAACRDAGAGVIAREPLAGGFLSGKYGPDARFGPGDVRADWPQAYRARLAAGVEPLRFLATPERTLAQAALRFVLASEDVGVVIPGARTVAQVEENFRARSAPELSVKELEQIFEITAGCGEEQA